MSQTEMPYEIKFLLDGNQVLTDKHELRTDLVHLDQAEHQQLDIRFLDTSALDLYRKGWILRGRLKQGKDRWEITFKKRIALQGTMTIENAIQEAEKLGFDLNDPSLNKEVDWTGEHQSLNLSYEVKVSASELNDTSDWKITLMKHAPEPLRLQQWGEITFKEMLSKSNMYGPIPAQKYQGERNGVKESIEIWTVAGSSIVEITTEALGMEAAQSSHELMANLLQQQNLLVLQPGLSKTGWALKKWLQTVSNPFSLLLEGGFNLYFRHAQPESTDNDEVMLSQSGQEQARKLGELLSEKKIPIQLPVSASPINRARQTAELAFSEKNILIEPRLIQKNHLPQLLEIVPKQGFNQVFVAHHFTFNNQLKEYDDFIHLGMVWLKPLGEGKGYTVVQVLDLLQEALIKHSSDIRELTLR
ncbi:histidine phosphatase family protein [Paenibacillus sp. Leaf72]|uniref:histidine phosphatase family protein n=1 Tax=Paenibacillus sp. Leaf72 TaxID=1736234 RepID=UPI0006FFE49A|nr:histidine phosphatase family protein [Paenibacillus sp. Leaf72]KQO18417.1 hypothetical protein ASF12_07345 [Paenibacillus sp. Leaf72]